jgi:Ulp1 family protease
MVDYGCHTYSHVNDSVYAVESTFLTQLAVITKLGEDNYTKKLQFNTYQTQLKQLINHKVNLFEKEYIFFPFVFKSHWSLICVIQSRLKENNNLG